MKSDRVGAISENENVDVAIHSLPGQTALPESAATRRLAPRPRQYFSQTAFCRPLDI